MFSFRVADARIAQLLNAMPDRSDFIRQAVIEKLRDGPDGDDQNPAPEVMAHDPDTSEADHVQRLRDGLIAIANGSAAILDAGGENVPDVVRVGLTSIGEAAAILAAGQPGGDEMASAPPCRLTVEPVADATIVGLSDLGIEALSALDQEMPMASGASDADLAPDSTVNVATSGNSDHEPDTATDSAMSDEREPELPFGAPDADPASTPDPDPANLTHPDPEDQT